MAIDNAPSEILEQIFLLLPNTRECMSVCKSWHIPASRIFYSNVKLTRNNASKFISHNQNCGSWVRYLNFDMDTLSAQEFKELVYQVTNVKVIDISVFGRLVLPFLDILLNHHNLQCIQEIKVFQNLSAKARELHFLACFNYRETITHLNLNNFRSCYTMNDISGNCLDFLPQFKQLTWLSIHNDLLNGDRYMMINSILDACPKLIQFQLSTKRHFPDGSKPALLTMMENDVTIKKKRIKHMKFHLHDFHEGYIKYLIFYTQLHTLKLHMIDTDIHDWLVDKENVIIPFAKYLSLVNNLEIIADTIISKRQQRTHLQQRAYLQQGTNLQDRMTRHWNFLNTIIGDRKLNCHVYLSMNGGYNDYQMFKLNMFNQRIILEYELKPEYPTNNLISLFTTTNDDVFMINSIEIGDATRYRIEDCLQLLQYVFKKCPNIKFIILNRSTLCYRLEAIGYPYNIHFDSIKLNCGEGRNYTIKSTRETLNHVSLKDAILSTELMQVLCSPDIKVLKLIECTIPPVLDLTTIKHLHYLEITSCVDNESTRVLCNKIDLVSIHASSCIVVQT